MKKSRPFSQSMKKKNELNKIKKILGMLYKNDKFHLRVLWIDRYITWETPDTLNCPILFENFLHKTERLIMEDIDKEEKKKEKLKEKQFISELTCKKTDNSPKQPLKKKKEKTSPVIETYSYNSFKSSPKKGTSHLTRPSPQSSTHFIQRRKDFKFQTGKKSFAEPCSKEMIDSKRMAEIYRDRKSKLDFSAYKPATYQKTSRQFLADSRYFEQANQTMTPTDHDGDKKKTREISIGDKDCVVRSNLEELAVFKVTPLCVNAPKLNPFSPQSNNLDNTLKSHTSNSVSSSDRQLSLNSNMNTINIFNVTHQVLPNLLDILLFTMRQNALLPPCDIFDAHLLDSVETFRNTLSSLNETVLCDISQNGMILFMTGKLMEKYDILNNYTILRFFTQDKTIFDPILASTNHSGLYSAMNKALWYKDENCYTDQVFGHLLFTESWCQQNLTKKYAMELTTINHYFLFSSVQSALSMEIQKFLNVMKKKMVFPDDPLLDTIFIDLRNLNVLNNMPFFQEIIESYCNIYLLNNQDNNHDGISDTNRITSSGPLEKILLTGGHIIFTDTFFESDSNDILKLLQFIEKNESKWKCYASQQLFVRCDEALAERPDLYFYRDLMSYCKKSNKHYNFDRGNINTYDDSIDKIKCLRSLHYKTHRYFYLIHPQRNDGWCRSISKFLEIVEKL